ncbi:MAG: hypothetical protein RLZZ366_2091, partial [Pseudomonadota bacterium]
TRRYDLDLLRELRSDRRAGRVLALSATDSLDIVDDLVAFRHLTGASDVDLLLPFIVFAQIFAFLQSLELGVRPDTPSASGTVSRIVRGVTIYPSHAEASDVSGR